LDTDPSRAKQDEASLVSAVIRGETGAWEGLLDRIGSPLYGLCADLFGERDAEGEYLAILGQLRTNDFAWLRAWDGRSRLLTYLTLKLGDFFSRRLVALFESDAERAWGLFERLYARDVQRGIARRFSGDRGIHADVYQEICLRLCESEYRRIRQYDGRGSFTGYIRRVVHRLCEDLFRKMKGRRRLPLPVQDLPLLDQEVFELVYWHGCAPTDVFERLRQSRSLTCTRAQVEEATARVEAALGGKGKPPSVSPRIQEVPLIRPLEDGVTAERDIPDPAPSPEMALLDAEEQGTNKARLTVILAAIERLPSDAQLYIRLRFLEDPPKRPREIARLMGRTEAEIYRLGEQVLIGLRTVCARQPGAGIPENVRLDGGGDWR
jgi:RNA polymerase primary sigma factor